MVLNFRDFAALLPWITALLFADAAFAQSDEAVTFAPDDCALFIWAGYPSHLQFISRADGRVTFSAQGEIEPIALRPSDAPDSFGQFASQEILSAAGQSATLELGIPAELSESLLYDAGTLTINTVDGWIRIESAQGVSTCNRAGEDKSIYAAPGGRGFTVPDWLPTPTQLSQLNRQNTAAPVRQVIIEPPTPALTPVYVSAPAPAPALAPEPIEIVEPEIVTLSADYTVQVGAFPTAELANQAWTKLRTRTNYLQEKDSIVQFAEIEGVGTLYRLRLVEFPDRRSAARFCTRLKSDGIDCFTPLKN